MKRPLVLDAEASAEIEAAERFYEAEGPTLGEARVAFPDRVIYA